MKKLLLLFVATIFTLSSYAQNQYATTDDGRKVILKNDGTWEYITNNTSKNSLISSNPQSVSSNSTRSTNSTNTRSTSSTKKSSSRTYIRGPRSGCYYINSNGGKTYVDRSLCN